MVREHYAMRMPSDLDKASQQANPTGQCIRCEIVKREGATEGSHVRYPRAGRLSDVRVESYSPRMPSDLCSTIHPTSNRGTRYTISFLPLRGFDICAPSTVRHAGLALSNNGRRSKTSSVQRMLLHSISTDGLNTQPRQTVQLLPASCPKFSSHFKFHCRILHIDHS